MLIPSEKLKVDEKIEEFSEWLTPTLQDIRQTEKFSQECENIAKVVTQLAKQVNFSQPEDYSDLSLLSKKILSSLIEIAPTDDLKTLENFIEIELDTFFNVLFIVTAQTDNNIKNHVALALKEEHEIISFPERKLTKKNCYFELKPLKNVLKSYEISKKLTKLISSLYFSTLYPVLINTNGIDLNKYLIELFETYIRLLLTDHQSFLQFFKFCEIFINQYDINPSEANLFITPLVIFKIRGSITASIGHYPEIFLREQLQLIGLKPNHDFNITDVKILNKSENNDKTRAYDFILPYNVPGWDWSLFIQSQYYAGDSGSVSHKVIDQTISSRNLTKTKFPDAKFIEYLDGAGYLGALKGDLKHMLSLPDTHSFFQMTSIFVRLRREFQNIGYLTPIELEHAILRTENGLYSQVNRILLAESYSNDEIERCINFCLQHELLKLDSDKFILHDDRLQIARRLFMIDLIAIHGNTIRFIDKQQVVCIPGYGSSYGMLEKDLTSKLTNSIKYLPVDIPTYIEDRDWLHSKKCIKFISW